VTATERLFSMQRFGMEPGLERIRALLERLDHPQHAFESVLIAGTNGKGSTSAHLAAMLQAAGRRTGRFTSPHLVQPGERIVTNGRPLDEAAFEALAERLLPHAEAVGATFFEVVTAMAVQHFADVPVDVAVMEVGLGGRFDATNALEPVATVVTSIALDHRAILGDTVQAIAREKAGILRSGVPAWTSAQGDALAALRGEAVRVGASLRTLTRDGDAEIEVRDRGLRGSEFLLKRTGRPDLPLATPLIGRHQADNAALAALTALDLGVPADDVAEGALRTQWPGRLEPVAWQGERVLLDGAHNPAAAHALAATLAKLGLRPMFVVSVSADKDVNDLLAAWQDVAVGVHVTRARHSPRSMPIDALAAHAREARLQVRGVHDDPMDAMTAAWRDVQDGEADAIVVAGSLFLVGEVRAACMSERMPPLERWQ